MPVAQTYKVKPTDTLSKLGNPSEILKMNPGLGKLSMGQVIKLPPNPPPNLLNGINTTPSKGVTVVNPIDSLFSADAELQRISRLIQGGVTNPLILSNARNYINNLITTNRSIDANALYQRIGLSQNETANSNAVANTFNWRL